MPDLYSQSAYFIFMEEHVMFKRFQRQTFQTSNQNDMF